VEAHLHPARADGPAGSVLTRVSMGAVLVAVAVLVAGCAVSGERPTPTVLRFVALGDSYTIGTSVEPHERFPDQLVAALGPDVPSLQLVANLGVNGYTSADLIRHELPALEDLEPGFVTVLIGVNDVVQGVPIETYEANVATILDALLAHLPADRIVTVAIPDYTVTPAGADYGDPTRQHDGIVANNAVMERLARARGIAYVDIFDLSLRAADDRTLVADDGLHASGAQYRLWVERIQPVVERLIGRSPT
jgi:acyl-CoA thioesterase-1